MQDPDLPQFSPLVSCLMPTRARYAFLPAAVANFLAQDFVDAELMIVSEDGVPDSLAGALRAGRVRHVACPGGMSLGAKRNFACRSARGEYLAHWDDDDWYAPDRLRRQVEALRARPGKSVCGSSRVYFREIDGSGAWEYRYQGERQPWLCGSTLLFRRAFWQAHPFPDQSIGEDNHFVWSARPADAVDLDDPALCIASVHAGNTSRKDTTNAWWTAVPRASIETRIEAIIDAQGGPPVDRHAAPDDRPRAVLALAGGLGDVLRWASLVPVLDAAGYAVELSLAADYPDVAALFAGARGVRGVYGGYGGYGAHWKRPATGEAPATSRTGLAAPGDDAPAELAVIAYWAESSAHSLPARRRLSADRQRWYPGGDRACIESLARELGWRGPLPLPPLSPAAHGGDASLVPGTLAIHAGCKADWPWKKWHGFGELACEFAHVLRVGTAADDDASGTYFGRPIGWPAHVRDATSPRPLLATARLLAGCTALVANDSGLMHLGAALGVPTLGIFGLTSPAREAMPWPALYTQSGGLDCEAACRQQPWGRRSCAQRLACLQGLAAATVAARLRQIAPRLVPATAPVAGGRAGPGIAASPPQPPAALALAIRLSGGFGDLLLAAHVIEALWRLSGFGRITAYSARPELATQALGGRGQLATSRPLSDWPAAAGLRIDINQFVRFLDPPERWRASHPQLAALIARAQPRLSSVRALVDRHPQLDGFWARINLAAGRQRGDALAWTAGLSDDPADPAEPWLAALIRRCAHAAAPGLALDEADAGPRLALAAHGRRWLTVHDGFDDSARLAPGGAVKCWPIEHWNELVRQLKSARPELAIVQIGGANSRPIAGVDHDFVGRIRLGEALWLLHGAALHIDGESGLVHAARALGTPSVVLFGPTDARFFGHADNCNLDAGVCAPCWWSTPDWMGRCPRGLAHAACMAAIAPGRVLAAALARLDSGEDAAADATPAIEVESSAVWSLPDAGADADIAAIEAFAGLVGAADGHSRSPRTGCHLHATKRWEYAAALRALGAGSADGDPGGHPARHAAQSPLSIADLGCGRSPLGPWLAAQGHAVSGFDRDFAWDGDAPAAQRFLGWSATTGFAAFPASLYALPVDDVPNADGFSAVLMLSVLQHLAQPALALREALRLLRPGGRLILSFDLANQPGRFEDPRQRRTIPSPARLAAWLGLAESRLDLDAHAIERSAAELNAARVAGMPDGLTVGMLCLRKCS